MIDDDGHGAKDKSDSLEEQHEPLKHDHLKALFAAGVNQVVTVEQHPPLDGNELLEGPRPT